MHRRGMKERRISIEEYDLEGEGEGRERQRGREIIKYLN